MRYCKLCVTPDTRPAVVIDAEGICNLCRAAQTKHNNVDWQAKEKELTQLLETYRGKGIGKYDCLIPGSGGKDSTWQLLTMQKYGMSPLVYHFSTCPRTPLGEKNFQNFIDLGVDVVQHIPNPNIYKKLMLEALKKSGDHCLFCNFGIFAGAVRVAINYGIKLIIYGESGSEFGVVDGKYYDNGDLSYLDQGKKPVDFISNEISIDDLNLFIYPTMKEIERSEIRQVCLGNYIKYDPISQLELVEGHGFTRYNGPWLGTYKNDSDLDCPFFGVHDYLGYIKYGYGRASADASKDIRNGIITRNEAIKLVNEYDGKYDKPNERYYFKSFLDYVGISETEFHEIAEKFRNKQVWKNENGKWLKEIP